MKKTEDSIALLERVVVRAVLGRTAADKLLLGDIPHATLSPHAETLKKISAYYVSEREKDNRAPEITTQSAEAYALYYLPINFAKFELLLRAYYTSAMERAPGATPLSLLDLGAGPATATLAALSLLHTQKSTMPVTLTLIEQSEPMKKVGSEILKTWQTETHREMHSSWHTTIDKEVLSKQYDLILVGNFLNETAQRTQSEVLGSLINRLTDGGLMVIIEPALKAQTQELMQLRDQLLQSTDAFSVLYPCTHHNLCPMRTRDRDDWCHFTYRWNAPRIVIQLDELCGFNKHRTKYSALVLKKENRKHLPAPASPALFRVITPALRQHRGNEATMCGAEYYGPVLLPKKQRTDDNRIFDRLVGGECVSISEGDAPFSGEIRREMAVQKLTP